MGAGGARGLAGAAVGSGFRADAAAHRRPQAAESGGLVGGGWRFRGVEVEVELQGLPKLHVKCLSATIALSFNNSIQIPQ